MNFFFIDMNRDLNLFDVIDASSCEKDKKNLRILEQKKKKKLNKQNSLYVEAL